MARSTSIIKKEITEAIMQQNVLVEAMNLDVSKSFEEQTSKTNLIGLMAYVMAVAIFTLETLYDQFKSNVDTKIRELKPHSLKWYNNKIKAFQYGHGLVAESDIYENDDKDSRIIRYSAVDEINGELFVKVAKDDGNSNPSSLDDSELNSFKNYMAQVKDAGVILKIKSEPGDSLRLSLNIHYDPLILNSEGIRLDGQDEAPVQNTIRDFIKNLPFNGVFTISHLVDTLQVTEGVTIPEITSCETKSGNHDYKQVGAYCTPNAGYLELTDENLQINWVAYV
ncbi:hypothetical protein L3073_17600 [Ancylomarina sp. DW003]|nr:hypothetical protein [Ancylomarina sp. DW003]MDE5424034.1 hypothetical protein [Ancylomarina sp. DW003]